MSGQNSPPGGTYHRLSGYSRRYSGYKVKPKESGLKIGDLSTATGVKTVTIRYYEQVGLIPAVRRTTGNYRTYAAEHIQSLQFIRRLRDLGFTLGQIRDLLRLSSEKNRACADVDRITNERLSDVENKVRDLRKLAVELRRLSKRCQGGGLISNCQIVEALLR